MVNVGERWKRKAAANDGWDHCRVIGVQRTSQEAAEEYVLQPLDGISTVSVTEADLRTVFVLDAPAPEVQQPTLGLDALGAWVA
jgi:hypothetical protein